MEPFVPARSAPGSYHHDKSGTGRQANRAECAMKIIFAGTPDFAAVALERLIQAGHDVSLVLSQPDRPSGRGMKLTASPVKLLAQKHGIEVLTPLTLSLKKAPEESAAIYERLRSEIADVLIVAAYGLILPQPVLDCARGIGKNKDIRAINIHASLLPRWRGAAPIARAIEAGDPETGITLMKMELGLDTGPMIMKSVETISADDTNATLTEKMAKLGGDLIVKALEMPNALECTPQPKDGITYAEKLLKAEGRIHWTDAAHVIERRLRAFTPFPGLQFEKNGEFMKIWGVRVVNTPTNAEPGTVLEAKRRLVVACGENSAIEMTILQRPGKGRMPVAAFLQSVHFEVGERLA